jgi:hypothetical protein
MKLTHGHLSSSVAVGENMLFTTAIEEAVVSLPPRYRKELFKKLDDRGTDLLLFFYPLLLIFMKLQSGRISA